MNCYVGKEERRKGGRRKGGRRDTLHMNVPKYG